MGEYSVTIEASFTAKNFESAQHKTEEIKEKVKRIADAAEVHLRGGKEDRENREI